MKIRETARLVLIDPQNRLLLMKVNDPATFSLNQSSVKSPLWVTLSGEIQSGEDVIATAKRELFEETGITDAEIGPAIWYGEQDLIWKGELTRLKETFVVVKTSDSQIVDIYRTPEEQLAMLEVKWWHIDELEKTSETILPPNLAKFIYPILTQNYPTQLINITLE
jgi:8-oxo-dGTP pyrophosphatase MutT (NUDIX family)